MIERADRTVNGKFQGRFYTMSDGQKLYLEWAAGEKTRAYSPKHNAWILTTQAIGQARHHGCTAIGILHRIGKKRHGLFITHISNFINAPSEPHYVQGKEPMRRLNKELFEINSTRTTAYIEKSVKIR